MRNSDRFLKVGSKVLNCRHITHVEDLGDSIRVYFTRTTLSRGYVEFSGDDVEEFRRRINEQILNNVGQPM